MTDTKIDDLPVVILCGGMGTRLREATESLPKPLVDIGSRPILWHIMKIYSAHGPSRFLLCLGYKSEAIKSYFLRYREHMADFTIRLNDEHQPRYHNGAGDEHWEVTCAETGLYSGTGARLRKIATYLDTDTFLFTYGDGVGNVDISRLVEFHREQGRVATVTAVHPPARYGEMSIEDATVTEFNEKPSSTSGYVSGGFFVFQRQILDYLSDEPGLMLEQEPLQKVARDGQLSVYRHDGYWMGMDTYRDYQELNRLWDSGSAPWLPAVSAPSRP